MEEIAVKDNINLPKILEMLQTGEVLLNKSHRSFLLKNSKGTFQLPLKGQRK